MAKMMSLAGKTAIVTGSSSGIGIGIAVRFAELGAQVVLTGRNLEGLEDAKNKCLAAGAKEKDILSVPGELANGDFRKKLVNDTVQAFGKIDTLINNAGLSPITSVLGGTATLETFDKIFNVNVRAAIDMAQLCVPHLLKTKGNIINIASVAGVKPVPSFTYYCMSKCALEMYTRCLAQELGPKGVRVNTVSPGAVRSNLAMSSGLPITKEQVDYFLESSKSHSVLNRIGEPEDIGYVCAFLSADQARFITGINLVSDGGNLICQPDIIPK